MLYRKLVPLTILILALTGCEETRTGIIDTFIFDEEGGWLERNFSEDPYELVDDRCCNDIYPLDLPIIDTTIQATIKPLADLDYYNLQVTGSFAGLLFLTPENSGLTMRLFQRSMEEFDVELDNIPPTAATNYKEVLWTTVYGLGSTFTLLVKSDGDEGMGGYTLEWERVGANTLLDVKRPRTGDSWPRAVVQNINWNQTGDYDLSAALLKGSIVVQVLARNIRQVDFLRWMPDEELEPGNDYRIMIYQTDNPQILDISDAFEIR